MERLTSKDWPKNSGRQKKCIAQPEGAQEALALLRLHWPMQSLNAHENYKKKYYPLRIESRELREEKEGEKEGEKEKRRKISQPRCLFYSLFLKGIMLMTRWYCEVESISPAIMSSRKIGWKMPRLIADGERVFSGDVVRVCCVGAW